ncbi:MAG TPA: hypothetical protein DCY07_01910 [Rhodospirillaceae bacterium]|nr:hypothetical protein [Rhodospirillaceae bacterium]
MNPLSSKIITGTTGELLVQLRLFQYGVQASAPLADSGNDLIGVKGDVFKAIQVKTTAVDGSFISPENRMYHILAFVKLDGEGDELKLDRCQIFLIPKEIVESEDFNKNQIDRFCLNADLVDELFN